MPDLEDYIAEVTVSVELRVYGGKELASYSVTREARGTSRAEKASKLIDTATAAAIASSRSLATGVDNAEGRRLKR